MIVFALALTLAGAEAVDDRNIVIGVHAGGYALLPALVLPQLGASASINIQPSLRLRGVIEGNTFPGLGIVSAALGVAWTPEVTSWWRPWLGGEVRGSLLVGEYPHTGNTYLKSASGIAGLAGFDFSPIDWLAIQSWIEIIVYPPTHRLSGLITPAVNLGVAVYPEVWFRPK